jgi:hypothetical protein
MIVSMNHRGGLRGRGLRGRGRGLGTVSVPVAGSLVDGSSAVQPSNNLRAPLWGSGLPMRRWPGPYPYPTPPAWRYPTGPSGILTPAPGSQLIDGLNLAQIQQLAQTNPGALTQAQIQALQAAGTLPGTLPASSASLITSSAGAGAIDPVTGIPYATEIAQAQAGVTPAASTDIGTTLQTPYAGLPLYLWLLIGGGGLYLMSGKRGR